MWSWAALAAGAQPFELSLPPIRIDAQEYCYPSGLKVQAVRRPDAGLVAVTAVVTGGWAAEQPSERGAAHLVEHLWFQSRPQGAATVETVIGGLSANAQTNPDTTVYTTMAAPGDLGTLLNIEVLRLMDPLAGLTDEDVADERRVVHNEYLYRGEHVVGAASAKLHASLFPAKSLYAAPPRMVDNDAVTREALVAYARRQYRPEHTTIRIEGDVDPGAVRALVGQVFPPALLSGSAPTCGRIGGGRRPPPATTPDTSLSTVDAPMKPGLLFGWTLPGGWSEDDVVGGIAAAWLDEALEEAVGRARGIGDDPYLTCSYRPMVVNSLMECFVELGPTTNPEGVERRIRGALDGLHDELGDADRSWSVQAVARFDWAMVAADAFDTDSLADRAVFAHQVPTEIDPLFSTAKALYEIQPKALKDYAGRWLTADRMAAVSIRSAEVDVADSTPLDGTAALDVRQWGGWAAPAIDLSEWRVSTDPDGLDVWVIPTSPASPPVVSSTAQFEAGGAVGRAGAWWADGALAQTSVPLVDEVVIGTATMFASSNAPGSHMAYAIGPSGNVDAQLYAIRQQLGPITYWGRASLLSTVNRDARRAVDEPEPLAADARNRHLLGEAAYGATWWRLDEAAKGLPRGALRAWRRSVVRPERGAIVVSGRVDPAAVSAEVGKRFEKWHVGGEPLPNDPAPPLPAGRAVFGYAQSDVLTDVVVACRVPGRNAETDAASDVLLALVQRGMDQTLRDRGGAYGYGVSVESFDRETAVLELHATVGRDSGGPAARALLGLLAAIAQGPSAPTLTWGQRAALNRHAERLASGGGAFDVAVEAVRAGLSLEALAAYPGRVAAVDAGSLRGLLASSCLGKEVVTVIGPEHALDGLDATWRDWAVDLAQVTGRRAP